MVTPGWSSVHERAEAREEADRGYHCYQVKERGTRIEKGWSEPVKPSVRWGHSRPRGDGRHSPEPDQPFIKLSTLLGTRTFRVQTGAYHRPLLLK